MKVFQNIPNYRYLWIIGILTLTLGHSNLLIAAGNVIGTVGIVRGEAFIKVGSTVKRVEANAQINEKDKVEVSHDNLGMAKLGYEQEVVSTNGRTFVIWKKD